MLKGLESNDNFPGSFPFLAGCWCELGLFIVNLSVYLGTLKVRFLARFCIVKSASQLAERVLDLSFGLRGGSLGERPIEVASLEEDFGLRNPPGRWCCAPWVAERGLLVLTGSFGGESFLGWCIVPFSSQIVSLSAKLGCILWKMLGSDPRLSVWWPRRNCGDLTKPGDLGGSGGAEFGISCIECRLLVRRLDLGGKTGPRSRGSE